MATSAVLVCGRGRGRKVVVMATSAVGLYVCRLWWCGWGGESSDDCCGDIAVMMQNLRVPGAYLTAVTWTMNRGKT